MLILSVRATLHRSFACLPVRTKLTLWTLTRPAAAHSTTRIPSLVWWRPPMAPVLSSTKCCSMCSMADSCSTEPAWPLPPASRLLSHNHRCQTRIRSRRHDTRISRISSSTRAGSKDVRCALVRAWEARSCCARTLQWLRVQRSQLCTNELNFWGLYDTSQPDWRRALPVPGSTLLFRGKLEGEGLVSQWPPKGRPEVNGHPKVDQR